MDDDRYIQQLLVTNPLREKTMRQAIQELNLPPGSCGLDAGCGIGSQVILLAETVGAKGQVTGIDINPRFLDYAEKMTANTPLPGHISFQPGSIHELPFKDNTFDWLWSADCAGYPAANPYSLIKELARVVKPGGRVILLFWSSQMLLPGYPQLEAHLNSTTPGIAPFNLKMKPAAHYFRALGWFQEQGMEDLNIRTFVRSFQAPLDQKIKDALIALMAMRWPDAEPELSHRDKELYKKLCHRDSPDFILNLPDYYAFFTYTMCWGKVVKSTSKI